MAQFYQNLTKEKYNGVATRSTTPLSVSRDTLNPLLNYAKLKDRMDLIAEYEARAGPLRYWPHHAMNRFATHVMKYRFNYAVKGFFLYLVYADLSQIAHKRRTQFVTIQEDTMLKMTLATHTGAFAAVCLLI